MLFRSPTTLMTARCSPEKLGIIFLHNVLHFSCCDSSIVNCAYAEASHTTDILHDEDPFATKTQGGRRIPSTNTTSAQSTEGGKQNRPDPRYLRQPPKERATSRGQPCER